MATPKSQLTSEKLLKKSEATEKDILHEKTKKKPEQDSRRGAFMI